MLGDYTETRPGVIGQECAFWGHTIFEVLDWKIEMRCPHCQSTDLRKVSLVYREGLFDMNARTRLRGFLLGTDGPDVVLGRARTAGVQQTQLSKDLRPPAKWSSLKLTGWFGLCSFVALVAYVRSVMSSSMASSLPVFIYVVAASCLLLILGFLFWRHNHLVYPRQYAAWERSFLCMRCSSVNAQPIGRAAS